MIILAIDSGFDKTGYALFNKILTNNENKYLISGLIKTSKKDKIEDRLLIIYEDLKIIIKKYKPEIIVVEQLFFFKNQKTVIKVSQSQGIILLLAAQSKIKLEFLTPLQIKQIITGYGQADKKSVQKMISLTVKIDKIIKEDDETDAIACGLAYCYQSQNLIK